MGQKSLLVVVPDRLSDLLKKGEITERYYNPGDLFDRVNLLMTNDDQISSALVQKTVGCARLTILNLPLPSFRRSWGWNRYALRPWVAKGIELARRVEPHLIRTHGNIENGYLAVQIRKALGIPLVVSLHINPDEDIRKAMKWWPDWRERLILARRRFFERETLQTADWVLPVYESIREYALAHGARHVKVCYNALNPDQLSEKKAYDLNQPARLITVGRQFAEKNPERIMEAASRLPVKFTLVGDGPYHNRLRSLAAKLGQDKFEFIPSLPNDELCRRLPEFDLFVAHIQYYGISKTVLEALLTGLPVVINRRIGKQVPELAGDWIWLVENSVEGYYHALKTLLEDHERRKKLGRRAFEHSRERYSPEITEKAYVEIYRSLVPDLREMN